MTPKSLSRLLLLLCLLPFVGGCQSESGEPDGEALYLQFCAACHGVDGSTVANSTAPNLSSQALLRVVDDEFMTVSTALGRPGTNARLKPGSKMSAYAKSERGPLDDAEIAAIVAHIRTWQEEPSVPLDDAWRAEGDVEAGRALWMTDCAVCHGEDGWGELAPRLVGSTFVEHASDDFIRQTLRVGRLDGGMPAYDYDDTEMGDLIVFIRALGEEQSTP
jgi:cytochrome c oxidase cbb3-type subunit 3